MTLTSKLPNITETIFTKMSMLALQHNAINLGQGFPDFPMSEELVERVHHYMTTGHNQYVHMNGLPLLRQVLAEKIFSLYSSKIDVDKEITVTPGATYAIYTALTTVLRPGDEVIVFEPAYDSYIPNIEINGGVPVLIELKYPEYKIDWNEVRSKVTPKTRMIMLNTPHNPTGSVLSKDDIEQLRALVKDTGIFILSDEVYEHLIFDKKAHESILKYPDLFSRSFVTFSFGKTFHCTGWKMGYCVAPANLMSEYRKVHQFNCFTCNTPIQFAIADVLKNKKSYTTLPDFMQEKRDYFHEKMRQTRFTALPSYGSYFQLYSYKDISDENEMDFAVRLTKEYGVATIPTSAFYKNGTDNKVLRFCFSKKEATLDAAVERLKKV